jgi:hypothetical protein
MTLFDFKSYGTFTGPGKGNYNFDDAEPVWHEKNNLDSLTKGFDLSDIGVLFYNNDADYAYFHCAGTNTSMITLEKGTGNLQTLIANVNQSIFNGNINSNGNVVVNGNITANGVVNLQGIGNAASYMQTTRQITAKLQSTKKGFDIPHPTKENHRLRYICVEGPSAEVYFRGKLKNKSIIEIPDYWYNLVDENSIGVSLTPIGCFQELFVEKIESNKIYVRNNASGPIHCSYAVFGERIDGERNIPEYQGLTPNDYPGDNSEYTINGL